MDDPTQHPALQPVNKFNAVKTPLSLSRPIWICVESTARCNIKCVFCPRDEITREKRDMSMETFRKIFAQSPNTPYEMASLIKDGEPLLNKQLPEMIREIKQHGWAGEVRISSNGVALTESVGKQLIESGLDLIIISLTAMEKETYKKLTGHPNFEKVEENARRFIALRKQLGSQTPKIVVRTILMKELEHEIEPFVAKWKALADEITVAQYQNWGGAVANHSLNAASALSPRRPCRSPWTALAINWDGSACICPVDYNASHPVGNIHRQTVEEIWQGPALTVAREKHLRKKWNEIPICRNCDYWQWFDDITPWLKEQYPQYQDTL